MRGSVTLLFQADRDAGRRTRRLALLPEIVNGCDLLVRMRVVPAGEIQPNFGAILGGPVVLTAPGHLAARRLCFFIDIEPVAHVLAINDRDSFATAVGVADHILADHSAVFRVARITRLVWSTAKASCMKNMQFLAARVDLDSQHLFGMPIDQIAAQMEDALGDGELDASE